MNNMGRLQWLALAIMLPLLLLLLFPVFLLALPLVYLSLYIIVSVVLSQWLAETLGINFWIVLSIGLIFPPAYLAMILMAIYMIGRKKMNSNRSASRKVHRIRYS